MVVAKARARLTGALSRSLPPIQVHRGTPFAGQPATPDPEPLRCLFPLHDTAAVCAPLDHFSVADAGRVRSGEPRRLADHVDAVRTYRRSPVTRVTRVPANPVLPAPRPDARPTRRHRRPTSPEGVGPQRFAGRVPTHRARSHLRSRPRSSFDSAAGWCATQSLTVHGATDRKWRARLGGGRTDGRAMTRRGWVLFGALSLIWGIPYLLIKIAVADVDPLIVAFGRTLVAAVLLLPIALYQRALIPVFRRWKLLLVYTVVEISGPWLLLGHAETDVEQFDRRPAARRGADDRGDHPDRHRPRPVRCPPHPRAGHRLRRCRLPGRVRHPVRRSDGGRGSDAGGDRLRDRPDHHQSPALRPAADGRDHRVADRGDGALRTVLGVAVAGADHRAGRLVDRRARGDLHRGWRSWCSSR